MNTEIGGGGRYGGGKFEDSLVMKELSHHVKGLQL
jgi:hypothetical protein